MKDVYKLHVAKEGSGPPVILIHGGISTHRYWQDVASALGGRRTLFMPDMLGFGKSPKPRAAAYTLEQYIDCLQHTFKNEQFTQSPVLVGHSFGALVALRWAVLEPKRFAGLVLSAPIMFQQDKAHQQLASIALNDKEITSKTYGRLVTAGMQFGGWVPTRLAVRIIKSKPRHVIEDATSYRRYVFRRLIKNKHFVEHALDDLRQVTVPTKIALGPNDMTNRHALDDIKRICKANKQCQLEILGMGHNIPLEKPEVLAKTILSI